MRSKLTKITLAAGFMFALVFTFSCSSDEDDGSRSNKESNYKTKEIGDQVWLVENLNNDVPGSECYSNSPSKCKKYGRLYNWTTAMALPDSCNNRRCDSQISEKHQGICPSGWHIPNNDEWETLVDFAGGSSDAGIKLKAASGWDNEGNGKNTLGFSALPGGLGELDKSGIIFSEVGEYGYWWSADDSGYGAYYWYMAHENDGAYQLNNDKRNLFSVRCLQN